MGADFRHRHDYERRAEQQHRRDKQRFERRVDGSAQLSQ
jgi:hypothetical protein